MPREAGGYLAAPPAFAGPDWAAIVKASPNVMCAQPVMPIVGGVSIFRFDKLACGHLVGTPDGKDPPNKCDACIEQKRAAQAAVVLTASRALREAERATDEWGVHPHSPTQEMIDAARAAWRAAVDALGAAGGAGGATADEDGSEENR